MDVDLSAHSRVIANAVNRELLNLFTSPPTIDLPREDRLFHTRDFASANRFLLLLDEKFGDKTWNPHQEACIFRQFVPDSPAHASSKNFLRNIPAIPRDILPGVSVSTRFASYPAWRSSFIAAFYDGARLRQLMLD
jgi:hypothetical protein